MSRQERRAPRAGELRPRLEHLREEANWLALHAELGERLRRELSELGVPVWTPAEDLSFRRWIEARGGEQARELLAILDAELDAEMALLQAKEAARTGEIGPV